MIYSMRPMAFWGSSARGGGEGVEYRPVRLAGGGQGADPVVAESPESESDAFDASREVVIASVGPLEKIDGEHRPPLRVANMEQKRSHHQTTPSGTSCVALGSIDPRRNLGHR